jgi:uncharacterized protein DUF1569
MATMWDSTIRQSFADRSARLTTDTRPGWGKMNAAAMMAHLNDSYRMCLGELPVKSKNLFLRYTPIRQLIIFALPFPKGAPTAPELIARCDGAVLEDEMRAQRQLFDRIGSVKPRDTLQEHPAFGPLSYREYGALMAKHTEHHFRQFGL